MSNHWQTRNTEKSAKFANLSMSKIRHAVSILGFHFIPSKVNLPSCVEILPSIVKYCQLLFSIVKLCWLFSVLPSIVKLFCGFILGIVSFFLGVILSIAKCCQVVLGSCQVL